MPDSDEKIAPDGPEAIQLENETAFSRIRRIIARMRQIEQYERDLFTEDSRWKSE